MLRAHRISKRYGGFQALKEVSFEIAEGEVVAIIGPSGSGKSTLVRCLHQLEAIDSGAIYLGDELLGHERRADGRLRTLDERTIARQRQQMGMVFQQFVLFPHLTALANVTEGPVHVLRRPAAQAREEAMRLLERVGLGDKAHHYPAQLSGGQQQRVAIARALAMQPRLLLFDEPTSSLDPELVGEVLDVVTGLARAGRTMVVVTHEIAFAREAAHRVLFMEAGRILEEGPARELLNAPKTERLKSFLARVI